MEYEWDWAKATSNRKKHGLSFEEASTVFQIPFAVSYPDPDHSADEDREITIGSTSNNRIAFVSHCIRDKRLRIISARKATRKERMQYEKESRTR